MTLFHAVLAVVGMALYTVGMIQVALLLVRVWRHLRPPKGPDALA